MVEVGRWLARVAPADGLLHVDLYREACVAVGERLLVDVHLLLEGVVKPNDILCHLVACILDNGFNVGILLAAELNHTVGNGCSCSFHVLIGNGFGEECFE